MGSIQTKEDHDMKKFFALLLSVLLLSTLTPAALAEEEPLWTRAEGDGA